MHEAQRAVAERYRLDGVLGKGATSVVYRATDALLGRVVAIKVCRTESDAPRLSLLDEARALARLRHAHLVSVHDAGHSAGKDYVVMELVEGRPLNEVLREGGLLAPAQALRWVLQLASALQCLHRAGMVHRDVKPQNIVVDAARDHVTLVDLGIAKACASPANSGLAVGTPNYMSPEEASGRSVGPGSDVWSLGVTLYEALSGSLPFQGSTAAAIIAAVAWREAPSLRSVAPQLPRSLCLAVDRALSRNLEQRYPDAAAFAHGLVAAAVQDGLPLPSSVSGLPELSQWQGEAQGSATAALPVPTSVSASRSRSVDQPLRSGPSVRAVSSAFLVMGVLLGGALSHAPAHDVASPAMGAAQIAASNHRDVPPPRLEATSRNAPADVPAREPIVPASSPMPTTAAPAPGAVAAPDRLPRPQKARRAVATLPARDTLPTQTTALADWDW